MKTKFMYLMCFVVGGMFSWFFSASNNNFLDSDFYKLRIPVVGMCDVSSVTFDNTVVSNVRFIDFDYDIMFFERYIEASYSGLPDSALAEITSKIKNCVPDINVKYDNSLLLKSDIESYFSLSKYRDIYIVITDGKAVAYYKK